MSGTNPIRQTLDPFGITDSLMQVQWGWTQHPELLFDRVDLMANELVLLQIDSWIRMWGIETPERIVAVAQDIRFQDAAWTEVPTLNALKQHYLLFTRWLEDAAFEAPDVDDKIRRRAAFWLRQFLDAIAPSNMFWINPEAVRRLFATGGLSIAEGMLHWLEHLRQGDLPMVNIKAFSVGGNIATTPGQVVWRNELLELIQYSPTTAQVRQIPLVIIAPWINKYYILDLNPERSLLRWLVAQGFTVFVTSWKNPTAEMHDTGFEDYLLHGLVPALDAARAICNVPQVHALGYCIGGTLLLPTWLGKRMILRPRGGLLTGHYSRP